MSLTHLSDLDLLATLVGKVAAQQLLKAGGSLNNVLREVEQPYQVGRNALPNPLLASIEIARRVMYEEMLEKSYLTSPAAVKDYLRLTLRSLEHEEFHCVFLDAKHGVIDAVPMFRGTLTQTSVHPREVVKACLAHNAAAVIFAHNHPSGSSEPSHADQLLTSRLKDALALIDITVLDHFIVAHERITSFAEKGLI